MKASQPTTRMKKPDKIAIGQSYIILDDMMPYLLAQVYRNHVCLISYYDGNRWDDPEEVIDAHNISPNEWERITGKSSGWAYVEVEHKVSDPIT